MKINLYPEKLTYSPLEQIYLTGVKNKKIQIFDSEGFNYFLCNKSAYDKISFLCGGALGTQTVIISDENSTQKILYIKVNAKTCIQDKKQIFSSLLQNLFLTMATSCAADASQYIQVNGKIYHYLICWLRDHTHTLKGMKYFHQDIKTAVELYADTQREDGMLFERIAPKQKDVQSWRDYTFKEGNFIKTLYSNNNKTGVPYTLQRIPVENDVEYLFIECLYYTWKATGDTEWMKKYLDNCIKALNYSFTDKFRWSKKFNLLKRAYTIDTWDFIHEDDGKLTLGDNCFNPEKTTFGVMFGDNTGTAASCLYLAEMLESVGRSNEAQKYRQISKNLLKNLEKISWNGNFYTHHISENPNFKRDIGNTDEKKQITLSNAYSINRFIGEDKSIAIINTYKKLKKQIPINSPGEFYNCYPPFEKGFGKQNSIWQYMNGGVSTIVAGELARGAFNFGEENYAVDILQRIKKLADKHNGHLHVCFNGNPQTTPPKRKFTKLNLAKFANITPEWNEINGWGAPNNDLKNIPRGAQTFHKIPFLIANKGIGISYTRSGFAKEIKIPISAKFASIYLLHCTSGTNETIAEMEIEYSDGNYHAEYIKNGKNTGSWFMPESDELKHATHSSHTKVPFPPYQLAWRGSSGKFDNVGIFIWGYNNPYPEKQVSQISFRALKVNGCYFIPAVTLCDKPVWFPHNDLSFGIPDAWGAAAIVYALIEGLSGIIDRGVAFSKTEISPRWSFTNEIEADVIVKYEASHGYTAYKWKKISNKQILIFTSTANEFTVRLPIKNKVKQILLNGKPASFTIDKIGNSSYALINISKKGIYHIELSEKN